MMLLGTGGRFVSRLLMLLVAWVLVLLTLLHIRSMDLDLSSVPRLNSRYLLQKRVFGLDSSSWTPLSSSLTGVLQSTSSTTSKVPVDSSLSPKFQENEIDTDEDMELEPLVDRSPVLSEDKLLEEMERHFPSLPAVYWNKNKNKPMGVNNTCAHFPNLLELEFSNTYWQTLHTRNGTFQLYGAYLDTRRMNRLGPTIRILGMLDRIEPNITTFCQIWFQGVKQPIIVKTFEYKYIWYKKWGNYKQGIYQPYLTACVIPHPYRDKVTVLPPKSVSLVEYACDNAKTNLHVMYDVPGSQTAPKNEIGQGSSSQGRKDFAVCVKGLDFPHEDLSVRLVEWIELLHILGADRIFFYELHVHPNISKVLRHYEQRGMIHVTPITLAGGQPNAPHFQHMYLNKKTNHKRLNELIPYNDCFYKHMYQYKYIVLLDIDEVIVPVAEGTHTWHDLIARVLSKSVRNGTSGERASYNVRNVYFLDDMLHSTHGWFRGIPRYMHMSQHVYRTRNFTKPGQYVKCFHNTDRVLTLHNHFPLACLAGACTTYPIDPADAQLQHYRADCVRTLKKSCVEFRRTSVMDTSLWRYKHPLISRVTTTLRELNYFTMNRPRR